MARNIIAALVLAILAIAAWLVFRETPAQENKRPANVLKPIQIEGVDRLELLRREGSGSTLREVFAVLKKAGEQWRLTKPVDYPADNRVIDSMLEILGTLKVIDAITENTKKHHVLEVDDEFGIEVAAFEGDKALVRVIIGVSNKNITFVRIPGDSTVYRTVGMYRRTFDKSTKNLRDKTVTSFDEHSVKRIKYINEKGTLEMLKRGEDEEATFEPVGVKIQNFNARKAASNATALTHVLTRDFVDEPLGEEITGLGKGAKIVEIDAKKNGVSGIHTIWIGKAEKKRRQTYVKTSLSDQVFLVSTHVAARFNVGAEDFARTDEQLIKEKQLREAQEKHAAEHAKHRENILDK
ncbi:MAG: DUF4340 domain-containing protein [Deltaproteobacteria bacterium]|nr:DUF4340 domain-containing protein [Deltaproteobacteria bacterium]